MNFSPAAANPSEYPFDPLSLVCIHVASALERDRRSNLFLVNKSQDGGRQGVREAAWPSWGFDGSIQVLLGKERVSLMHSCM